MFYRNSYNANSVDPDQMPHFVASDLGLHCLPVTFLGSPDLNGLMHEEYLLCSFAKCIFK